MSLAELKRRLQKGVRLQLVERCGRPVDPPQEPREIAVVQTNAVAFQDRDGKLSWLWWVKGLKVHTMADGFVLVWPNENRLRYRWVADEPPPQIPLIDAAPHNLLLQ